MVSIIGNLIDNAIDAATESARPASVNVRLLTRQHQVMIEVSDTGPGVPNELSAQIFTDGFSTKPAEVRRHRGIGLALVHPAGDPGRRHDNRRLFQRHHLQGDAACEGSSRSRGRHVISTLIVEDDYHVATIHSAYVRRVRGFTVIGHASTAASARTEIRRLAPELVLLDLYLPDGHGLDLLRETLVGDHQRPGFLVITAARDMASVRAAMHLGAVHSWSSRSASRHSKKG